MGEKILQFPKTAREEPFNREKSIKQDILDALENSQNFCYLNQPEQTELIDYVYDNYFRERKERKAA